MSYLPYLSVFIIVASASLAIAICYMAIQISRRKYALSKIWLFLAASGGYAAIYLILNIFHILPFAGYSKSEFSQLALVLGLAAAANLFLFLLGYIGKLPGQRVRHVLPLKTLSFMIFLQFLVISTLAWTFILFPQIENLVLEENVRRVNLIAHYRANAVTDYNHSAFTHLQLAAQQDEILKCLNQQPSEAPCDTAAIQQFLQRDQILTNSFQEYYLWDKSGNLLFTSDLQPSGVVLDQLATSITKPFSWITSADRDDSYLNIPINRGSNVIGYLSGRWNLQEVKSYLEEPIGSLSTDEYYFINSAGKTIFSTNSSTIDNQNSRECLLDLVEVREHGLQEYVNKPDHKDYYEYSNSKSEKVIASHAYIPAMESCLLVEVSQREVLQLPQTNILRSMLVTTTTVIALMIIYTLIAGRIWSQEVSTSATMPDAPQQHHQQ